MIKTMLQTVIGYSCYTTLDISEAYFCMLIHPNDRYKLAFRTPDGLYQFCRLPFGILTGCALWNRKFQEILKEIPDANMKAYFDDLIIFTEDVASHIPILQEVLRTLLRAGLRIKLKKCQIMQTSVKFLGFSVSRSGSSPTKDGVRAIQELSPPKTLKQLRSFLGAIGYYRDFIPNFGETATPLYGMTKKNVRFKWNPILNTAWRTLKEALSSDLILIPPDSSKHFYIATDATQNTIAAVLLQKQYGVLRPIEYFSRRLKDPESRYHTNQIEGLAIFASYKRWEHFLLMNKSTVMTDNSGMTFLFDRKEPCNARVARWQIYLSTFCYKIIHVKGSDNKLADYISRYANHSTNDDDQTSNVNQISLNPSTSFLSSELTWLSLPPSQVRVLQEAEPRWFEIIKFLQNEKASIKACCKPKIKSLSDFALNDRDILCVISNKNNKTFLRPVIPSSLIVLTLQHIHDSEWANHPSARKTRTLATERFYWPTMLSDTIAYAKSCISCQKFFEVTRYFPNIIGENKIIPLFPNEALSIDILYMQPATTGEKYILSIMDMYSRFCRFYPIRDMLAETISTRIIDHCCLVGFPNIIFTDDATNLSAALSRNIFSTLKVTHSVREGVGSPNLSREQAAVSLRKLGVTLKKGH